MYCKYSGRDIHQRLDGTVCFYDLVPVHVSVSDNGEEIYLRKLTQRGRVWKTISPNDVRLDIASLDLGYVNFDTFCVYAKRQPLRNYKQGVTPRNTNYYSLPNRRGEVSRSNRVNFELFCPSFNSSLIDDFPSQDEVIRGLREGVYSSRACRREIAFEIDNLGLLSVFYKNNLVGHILPNANVVSVPNSNMSWIVSAYLEGFGIQYD